MRLDQKNVGIWIRVSTEDQVKGESPEHHEKRARQYAELKGWNVKKIYRLDALSGKSVMNFQETNDMLNDVYDRVISGLIFTKLARLARNTKELLEFADIFQEYNADLISLGEMIDTSSPAGRLFYTLIAAMAQWEREEISERVSASVPVRAKLGKPLGGAAPFGYKWVNKNLVINEKEAPIRKLMFELFLKIKRKNTVAKELNKRGYRTRNGSKFTGTTLTRLLTDPIAKGKRRMNYTKSLGKNKKWEIKPKEEWIFVDVPAIVSKDLWNNVNAIIDEQREKIKRPSRKVAHLFSGLIKCHCGKKMYVVSNMNKYVCQECRNKIGENDMEEIFIQELRDFLESDEMIKNVFDDADSLIQEKEKELSNSLEETSKLESDLNELIQLHKKGELPTDGFGRHYKPIHEQLNQLNENIPKLQAEIDVLKIERMSGDQIIDDAKNLEKNWPKMTFDDKRSIIEHALDTIVIEEKEIEIKLAYLPNSPHSPISPKTSPFATSSKTTTKDQHNHMDSYSLKA